MENQYLYFILLALTLAFPLAWSFEKRWIHFSSKWRFLFPAIILVAIPFLIWDHFFTKLAIWGFNDDYITGWKVGELPVEEILFFFIIPYSCFFIYESVKAFQKKPVSDVIGKWLLGATGIVLLVILFNEPFLWYTKVTFSLLVLLISSQIFIFKVRGTGNFVLAYLFSLIPFFLVNGVLTGTWIKDQVVWYNDAENMGRRLGTIPVEDTMYALLLLLGIFMIYESRLQKYIGSTSSKTS